MNKASGGDGIPVELFQILKDDAVKVLHSICQQIWKTQQWPQDWKRSVLIPIPKNSNAERCANYHTIALISHSSKVMLKILQARLKQYMNHNLPDVQAGFRKGRGTRDQIANICWMMEKESSRKTSTSALLTTPKPLTVWITTNCGKFLFYLYAEYIMRNTGLEEAQAGIKIAGRNINNLRYAGDTSLMA